jgi:hypothetical protein
MRTVAGAAAKLAAQSFAIDGEAVVCGPDGNHRFLSVWSYRAIDSPAATLIRR